MTFLGDVGEDLEGQSITDRFTKSNKAAFAFGRFRWEDGFAFVLERCCGCIVDGFPKCELG